MQRSLTFALLLAAGLAGAPQLAPQQATEGRYQAETTLVIVDAIVTDRKGHPLTDLTAADFRVYEDGVEQTISAFSPPEAQTPSDRGASSQPKRATPEGGGTMPRFLTVVLDLADNRPDNIKRSCDAVLQYLDKAGAAGTLIAIYYIDRGLHLALPFTADRQQAHAVMARLQRLLGRGQLTGRDRAAVRDEIDELYRAAHPEADYGAVPSAYEHDPNSRAGPREPFAEQYRREIETLRSYLDMQNVFQARDVLVALRSIASAYKDLPGRKNVVLFSEGFRYAPDVVNDLDAVIASADAANVSFYVIDPTGLELGRIGPIRNSQANEIALEGAGDIIGGQTKFDRMRAISNLSDSDQLGDLADRTGGFLVKYSNDLVPAFARILTETRSFYTFAYHPLKTVTDGKFRAIRVEVKRSGLQVRHRKGYWAIPRGRGVMMSPAAAQLLMSVGSGAIRSAFTPGFKASVMLAPDGGNYVTVSVSLPTQMALHKSEDKKPLSVVAVARDQGGHILATYERDWQIALDPKAAANLPASLTLQGQMPLPELQPLIVQAVVRLPDGEYGVVASEVPLPPATASGLQLSSVLLSSELEVVQCAESAEALCIGNMRIRQPAVARFNSAGRLVAVLAASGLTLDPQTKKPHVGAVFSVKQGAKLLGSIPAANMQAVPGPRPDAVWLVAQLPLKGLAAGNYVMEVVTKDLGGNSSSTSSSAFEVEKPKP
ncbi:MAG: VWA domain-containing protein [Acidobacteriota bacterium]|nr:VWA domain-containing protein [Acidobacteriota bacterium]